MRAAMRIVHIVAVLGFCVGIYRVTAALWESDPLTTLQCVLGLLLFILHALEKAVEP